LLCRRDLRLATIVHDFFPMPLWNDCRFALRQLRKTPGFTLIVLGTLGLCIGANTAVYSVLDAVLLRPAPYPEAERLLLPALTWQYKGKSGTVSAYNGAMFESVRSGAPYLDAAAYSGSSGVNFSAGNRSEYVQQQRVSSGFFRVLGVAPRLGREFSESEDVPGGPPLVVLSDSFWRRAFQGDPGVLGRAIALRGEPYTVIGVMPAGFRTESPSDVWTPLRPSRSGEGQGMNYGVVARLRPGISRGAAAARLNTLGPVLGEATHVPPGARFDVRAVPFEAAVTGYMRRDLLIAWAAVLAVLLIGCVNIAVLLLARSSERSREIATRMALGGSRAAIVRQLLAESAILALGGGLLGTALGAFGIDWLKSAGAAGMQVWHPIRIDTRVFAAMLAVALATSLVFGLAPALATARVDIRAVLVEAGRGIAGRRRRWPRNVLVAAEVALSLVLLVSAGLLVRTLNYLNGLNPGFDTRGVVAAEASLQDARYNTGTSVNRLFKESLDRIRAIPGVQSASVALTLPYERPLNDGFRTVDGDDMDWHAVEIVYVMPAYFETLRIPLRGGRGFLDSDTRESARVAVVSQSFAAKYFRGREAVGRHLQMGGKSEPVREIVGLAGDVQQHSGIGDFGPLSLEPTIYVPASQVSDRTFQLVHTWFSPKWVIRTGGPLAGLQAQIQNAIGSSDPRLPIASFRSIDELRGRSTRTERYHAVLFSVLSGLALVLAAIGLFGVISHSVTQRTHEIGVRMALGATAGQTITGAVKPGLRLAAAGVAAGCLLSLAACRFLEHMLWGVRPTDGLTFVATAVLLLAVAAVASVVPALRILRLDPAKTLRNE
jgi:predicted permease